MELSRNIHNNSKENCLVIRTFFGDQLAQTQSSKNMEECIFLMASFPTGSFKWGKSVIFGFYLLELNWSETISWGPAQTEKELEAAIFLHTHSELQPEEAGWI